MSSRRRREPIRAGQGTDLRAQLVAERQGSDQIRRQLDEAKKSAERLKRELASTRELMELEKRRNDAPPAVQVPCQTCGSPFTPDHSLATGHTQ